MRAVNDGIPVCHRISLLITYALIDGWQNKNNTFKLMHQVLRLLPPNKVEPEDNRFLDDARWNVLDK